jgi:hypothetical protein
VLHEDKCGRVETNRPRAAGGLSECDHDEREAGVHAFPTLTIVLLFLSLFRRRLSFTLRNAEQRFEIKDLLNAHSRAPIFHLASLAMLVGVRHPHRVRKTSCGPVQMPDGISYEQVETSKERRKVTATSRGFARLPRYVELGEWS